MKELYRLLAVALGFGDAVTFLVGFEAEELDAALRFLATPAVAWGMITAGLVVAAWGMWPGIRWVCQYPTRRREHNEKEQECLAKEAIRLFKIATLNEEEYELAILADGGVKMETRATIARNKLSEMGLGLPESEDPDHLA